MLQYRLNSHKDGRIISTIVFDAEDDDVAIEQARERSVLVDGELWCGRRLVASIPMISEPEKPAP